MSEPKIVTSARGWVRDAARQLVALVDALPPDQRAGVLAAPCPWYALHRLRVVGLLGAHTAAEDAARMKWSMVVSALAAHAPDEDADIWLQAALMRIGTVTAWRLAGWLR